MLEVNQLTRKYHDFTAVDNISFSINRGEIVGLLGHNGAGKTTIMKMISGFLEPNQGSITVDGVHLSVAPGDVQMSLGYLPENLPIYPEMTIADYLDYTAELKGLTHHQKTTEIKRAITATEITEKLSMPISTLSRGYKQRVGVAQAILGHPKLLILDEPTNGLDPAQTGHMRQLIQDIAKDATVILSTHIMQEVNALCSRVLILKSGRLAVDAELETLRHTNYLALETSLPVQEMTALQEKIAGIKKATPVAVATDRLKHSETDFFKYQIELSADLNDDGVVRAELAKAIIDNGQNLFLLQPEYNDLETLFRKVNEESYQQETSNHAA